MVVRVGAMGDVLHALPAVAALREGACQGGRSAGRWIRALGGSAAGAGRGWAGRWSRVHGTDAGLWSEPGVCRYRTGWEDCARCGESCVGRGYDVCVDMQGTIRSAVIGLMAGAREFVGYADPRERAAGWIYGRHGESAGRMLTWWSRGVRCWGRRWEWSLARGGGGAAGRGRGGDVGRPCAEGGGKVLFSGADCRVGREGLAGGAVWGGGAAAGGGWDAVWW